MTMPFCLKIYFQTYLKPVFLTQFNILFFMYNDIRKHTNVFVKYIQNILTSNSLYGIIYMEKKNIAFRLSA